MTGKLGNPGHRGGTWGPTWTNGGQKTDNLFRGVNLGMKLSIEKNILLFVLFTHCFHFIFSVCFFLHFDFFLILG